MEGSWFSSATPELAWIAATLLTAVLPRAWGALALAALLLGTPIALAGWAAAVADTPLAASGPATLLQHHHDHGLFGLLLGYILWYLALLALPSLAAVVRATEAPSNTAVVGHLVIVCFFLPYYLAVGFLLDVLAPGVETVWLREDGGLEVVTSGLWVGPSTSSLPGQDLACIVRYDPSCSTDDDGEEDCVDRWRPVLGAATAATTIELNWPQEEEAALSLCAQIMAASDAG